jgi:hypothetical protein
VNALGQSFGGKLLDQLAPRVLTPAFAFWAGAVVAVWAAGYGRSWIEGLGTLTTMEQLALLVAALSLIAASAVVAEHLTQPVLRFLEGYWVISRPLRSLQLRRLARAENRLQVLSGKAFRGERLDRGQLAAVEQRLHDLPGAASVMPTRLGNILRAAENRVRDRYGLDPVVCWPHLWLCLDKGAQEELVGARKDLDDGARLWLWSLLFAVWTWATWWALLVSVVGCIASYYGVILNAARGYGQLMQAAFDLYRRRIYQGINWPHPVDPEEERGAGEAVTTYLWRGFAPPGIRFTEPSGSAKKSLQG